MKDRIFETTRRHIKYLAAAAAVIALAVAFTLTGSGANAQDLPRGELRVYQLHRSTSPPQDGARTNAEVGVLLSAESQTAVTVDFHTEAVTATAGQDYIDVAATLHFPPGVTRRTVDVPILGDDLGEYTERFRIHLTNPTGAQLGSRQGRAGDHIQTMTPTTPSGRGWNRASTTCWSPTAPQRSGSGSPASTSMTSHHDPTDTDSGGSATVGAGLRILLQNFHVRAVRNGKDHPHQHPGRPQEGSPGGLLR